MSKIAEQRKANPRRRRGRFGRRLTGLLLAPVCWLIATLFWIGEGLTIPFFWLVRVARWWLGALVTWWHSQSAMFLVRGLPFLLVTCLSTYVAVAASLRTETYEQYSRAANKAVAAGDNASARLFLERMARQNPSNAEILYRLCLVLNSMGDQTRSEAILRKIAPDDAALYVPAHMLRAKLSFSTPTLTREQLQTGVKQLFHVISLDPMNVQARGMLGELYLQQGAWEDAELHLQVAANESPTYSLPLAKSMAAQGKAPSAKRYGQRAQSFYREIVLKDRGNRVARLGWGESTTFLEEFSSAAEILQGGLLLEPDEPQFHNALTRLYVTWSDVTGDETLESRSKQFQLLAEALKHNPRDFLLFDRIMKVLKRKDAVTDEARELLVDNIANGRVVEISHLLLGTFYGELGETSQALEHLRIAHELDPSMYVVANNLAWYLAHTDPPRLTEALEIATRLASQFPQNAAIRDTRGHILAKMERWNEALIDLEAALPAMQRNTELHQTLATVYQHLGMRDLANKHQRIAQSLIDRQK